MVFSRAGWVAYGPTFNAFQRNQFDVTFRLFICGFDSGVFTLVSAADLADLSALIVIAQDSVEISYLV